MKKTLLLLLITILFSTNSFSQAQVWSKSSPERVEYKEKLERASMPTEFQVFSLNMEALKSQLQQAPSQDNFAERSNVIVQFPSADGTLANYRIYESATMHPDLASRYQDIKTYVGQGIEDPTASIHISTTLFGLHTMTLSGKTGTFFIDPYTKDLNEYMIYKRADLRSTTSRTFSCQVEDAEGATNTIPNLTGRATDGKYRTYRLAMACTIEYAAYHVTAAGLGAGTLAQKKDAVLAAMVISMARINGIYERDMSLKMQLVANNDSLIFITSDAFSNDTAGSLIDESQTVIDGAIGDGFYDIGHTVSTGGGGLAQRPCVCFSGQKARGITGSPAPVGDPYDIDFVAHEMGHQFGGSHTFAGDAANCGGGNRSTSTAVEPGSGTTIMAYAGICSPQDVQSNSDDHFHAVSLAEMFAHITGAGNCVAGVDNGNFTPVIPALSNYTIPNGTAFKLTAAGVTDANGDALTYCWEQNNASITSAVPSAITASGVNFRSYSPSPSPTRYFPKFADVIAGNLVQTWELLPTVARTMAFKVTVRDNRAPNGGQTQSASMGLTYASGVPFAVTSQNTTGISWLQGSTQTITWNVGGTAVPATTAVNILLSTDNGLTFPTVLAAATANDGTQTITVPNIAFPFCRILIEPTNNIYYAVNSKTFAIGYTVTNTCTTYTNNTALAVPDGVGANLPGATVSKTISVPITTNITDVNVTLSGTHTYFWDLVVALNHPDATQVRLLNRNCNQVTTGFNVLWNDASPAIVCAANLTGTFAPPQLLSAFNGKPANGTWTLLANDNYGGDAGTINNWSIEICSQTIALSTHNVGFDNFAVYPNPSNGNFNIQFSTDSSNGVKVLVHDMRGRSIFENDFSSSATFNQNIHLNNAQAGVYLLTVTDGERKEVKKIVVE